MSFEAALELFELLLARSAARYFVHLKMTSSTAVSLDGWAESAHTASRLRILPRYERGTAYRGVVPVVGNDFIGIQ